MITFRKVLQALGVLSLIALTAAWQAGNFPPGGGSGGGFPVTTPVTVGSGGSITPTGTGTITATNATTPFTISVAGSGNGVLALSGNTSGTATFTAPAVAGTSTNGITVSNVLLAPVTPASTPAYSFSGSQSTGMYISSGTVGFSAVGNPILLYGTTGVQVQAGIFFQSPQYLTLTNCAQNTASPAACGSAASGVFAIPALSTTYTVNTSAVTASSRIFLQPTTDNTGIPSAPTCVDPALTAATSPSSRVAATSFTLQLTSNAGITCYNYWIVN
jgi:hypothetical protein